MTRSGGDALIEQLLAEGVEVIFGLPGDQLMHALDALYDEPSIRYVTTRHEQATTYMADGYARASGSPGVAMVVPGVGVYNAASGLATAYACSSPVALIAGQVNRDGIGRDLGLLHDVHDQLDIVRPITKHAARVTEADEIPAAVRAAFAQMTKGRQRPVEVEIPPEAFSDPATAVAVTPVTAELTEPDSALVAMAAAALAASNEPLIVAGGGVSLGNASAELAAIAAHLQAAVVTTREGKGSFDDRSPLSVGTMWVNRRMRPILDAADVVLAVGTRLQGFGFAASTTIIHIDIDEGEIGKNAAVEVAIVGDAQVSLDALLAALLATTDARPSRADERSAQREAVREQLRTIGPQTAIIDAVRAALPDDAVIVPDTTTLGYMSHMYMPVYQPRTYLSSSYMGTLGFAFPTALGAKVGVPSQPVISLVGDGGFLFAATELATAVQFGINTVTVIFDDGAYGNSNRDQRERFGGREIGTELQNPDFVALAASFGAAATMTQDLDQLTGAIAEAVGADEPVVIVHPIERMPSPF
jgi:acetolactate synthase-1/2/3 large subunit